MMVCGKRLRLVILRVAGKGRQLSSLKQKGFTREGNVFSAVCCSAPEQHGMAGLCGRERLGEQGMGPALLFLSLACFSDKSHLPK